MKKRILPLLLSLVMLISLFPVEVMAAEPEMTITAGTVEVTAGDTDVEIPISVVNAVPVMMMGLEFILPEGVTLKKMTAGEAATTAGASVKTYVKAGTVNFEADNNITFQDGTILTLIVDVSSAASGSLTIQARPIDNNAGMIANEEEEIVPVAFVPGTITVKANTTDRTVTFMNGTEAATETVANGGTLTSIPDAPAATDGQSFLGWYAVEGTNYVLNSVDDTITGTEASTDAVITADTTYHAIWASSAMIAAGYATAANGQTAIGVVSAINGLQNFVNSYTGGTVKLLKNVDLAKGYVVIQSGTTVTLDLNGKTLSANGVSDKTTNWEGYGPIVNNGNLALISSTALTDKGVVQLNETAAVSFDSYGALTNHGTVCMENVKLVSESTFADDEMHGFACAYYGKEDATITTIQNCELHANRTAALYQYNGRIGKLSDSVFEGGATIGGKPAAVFLDGYGDQHYGTIENCTITMRCDDPDYSVAALDVKCGTLEGVTGCTITGPDGILLEDFGSGDCISPEIRTLNSIVEGTNGYAIRTTPDLSSYGDTYKDRKPVINFTGGKYKGTKGAEKYEGSVAITYPAGQKLVAGEDGWYTLQTAYTVTFKNGDTVLQTVTCGKNGTAAYTGSVPTKDADETYTYTFNGKWADGSGKVYTNNRVTNVTSDLTVTAQFDTASAKVVTLTVDGTSKNYTGLKAAVDALKVSGDYKSAEIKLNEDDTETEPVTVTKSVTLDLNGHKLTADTAENGITVSNGATLTFKDSVGGGVFKHTATSVEKSAILANGSGTVVNIESGTIEATMGNALTVDGAAFHVSGGTISGGQNGICVKSQSSSPECTISNGKIICNGKGYALFMDQSVAQYIKLSGGAFKNTFSNDGTYLIRYQDKCAFQDGKSLAPEADTEGFYAVRVVGHYTLRLTADKAHYNAGETVKVTVSAFGNDNINSFAFTPVFDRGKLTLGEVTALVTGGLLDYDKSNGKTGYVVDSETGIALGADGANATPLVEITFTANADANAATEINLTGLEMTTISEKKGATVSPEAALTVNLHDLRVTLAAGNGTVNGAARVTLYAKYDETGLYSDPARETPATVTAAAKGGYRLNNKTGENLWLCGNDGYASFDAIKGLNFTDSKTFDLQTTKVWTVSFDTNGMVGGSLSSTDAITVDDGTKLSAAGLPTATANTGYAFTGWTAGDTAINPDTYTVNGDVTLKPVFTVRSYAFTCTQNQSTVSVTAGVAGGKATYGKDVTFTVTPDAKHIVKQVSYTVGSSGTAMTIVPENGVYTIPGAEIVGEVALEITTVPYYAVTFKAGTGIDLTETTLYTFGDGSGFYTNTTFANDKKAEVPTPTEQTGYRLADRTGEVLWKDANETGYTAETVKTAEFRADTVLTAQSVKTYKVTFVSADPAMASISGSLTLDAGTTITAIPPVSYTAGYTFKEWRIGETAYASDEALKAVEINSDTTVTLTAKDKSYAATLTGGDAAEITDVTGLTDGQAVHGTAITFKLTAKTGYKVTAVAYQINGGAAVTLTLENGVYTIPGDAITGPVTLQLTSNETVTVTFAAGENGSVGGTFAFTLDKGGKLTADQLKAVTKTGAAGYTFKEWQIDGATKTEGEILGTTFEANTTVTAIFDHATYSVAAEGTSGVPTTATHGTNLTFTPTVAGKIVVGVTAKIGGTVVAVTKNANGSYTISGDAITGDLTITAQTVDGSWGFIDKGTYIALSADKKIAVLTTDKQNGGNYLLDGKGMYWSSKYNAYVKIVGKDETEQTLTAKLAFNASAAEQTLSYTGDINGSNTVTPADGGMINDELHSVARLYVLTEKERLEMDVNGDKKVSTEDIMCILRKYVGSN